jgi:hypothetical protein
MIRNSTRNQDELSGILDTCIELISNGSGTVDSVVAQYPDYDEQLRPALEAAYWLQSRSEVFNPRPGFVQLSQRRLVNRFKQNTARMGLTSTETLSRIPAFFQERRLVVQYSALLTLTAVLLFVGYQSTAFLVQRSIPGDPLYATKLAQEEMQISLTSNEEEEARLRIKFAQRRVIEMQELILVGRDSFIDEAFDNFKFQMTEAASGIMVVAKADSNSAAELSTLFEDTLTVPVKNLVGILDTTTEMSSVEFIDSVSVLAAEIFDLPPYEPMLALVTSTPTSTSTPTFTPTPVFTPTFTATKVMVEDPTATEDKSDNLPVTDTPTPTESSASRSEPTATYTPTPTNEPPPTDAPEPTNPPLPTNPPAPTDPPPPTVAPPPTSPPPATDAPSPTKTTEPQPDKTKKPKPTQHPTYRPPATPNN